MARDTLTGSRIRERRGVVGQRQSELARRVGISASYLNLIEHNRRRIGGKLLNAIAKELEVEPSELSEGAEATLVATVREAAADAPEIPTEEGRADEFAGRFPGWARLVADLHRRGRALEQSVAALNDRLAHDPQLAASLHEVLSRVTAIRSTASILVETREIEPEWQARFQRNIHEDSQRLADSSQALVRYLDATGDDEAALTAPTEEVDSFLAAQDYGFPALESGGGPDPAEIVAEAPELSTTAARALAVAALRRYRDDARRLPLDTFASAVARLGANPEALAREFDAPLAVVFRRLAVMPDAVLPEPVGLVVADAAGMLLFRKSMRGFPMPRFAAACPRWPLFEALSRPHAALYRRVVLAGRDGALFDCYAATETIGAPSFSQQPVVHAYMLISPAPPGAERGSAHEVGSTCRICAARRCAARREPSILARGV